MNAMLETKERHDDKFTLVTTTLYDLIEAMQDKTGPDADDLIVASVTGLFRTGRLAFLRRARHLRPFRPTLDGVSYS
jgi:hypothetical protein